MNRSVEQALTSLIPRHNGPLPPELLDLASSLLAQSRLKASNLKPDEEIGRTYACANIACERLKKPLNLPTIEPRPPCPPRIYNKLYAYLSTALPTNKRLQARATASNTSTPSRALPSRPTPTKERSLAPFKTTPSRSANKRSQRAAGKEIAPWIHPFVRALCRELNAPAAAPHVLAGVTSILTLPSPDEGKEESRGKLPALIAAVYFFVHTKLVGKEMSGSGYVEQRKGLLEAMERVKGDVEEDWEGWEEIGKKDVDGWIVVIENRGWLELDWLKNIAEGVGVDVGELQGQGEDSGNEKQDEEMEQEILRAGLGTMMQDRVDYLSERKRQEYQIWKEALLRRIEAMEAANMSEKMDTSG